MTKQEFLEELAECLRGEVTDSELQESVAYYSDYFSEQEGQGKTDEDIVKELGNPRLIAHSIIDARGIDELAERKALRGGRDSFESDPDVEFVVNDEADPESGWTERERQSNKGPEGSYYRRTGDPFTNGRYYTYHFGGGERREEPVDDSMTGQLKRIGRRVLGLAVWIGLMIVFFMVARALFPVILLFFVILMILRLIQQ